MKSILASLARLFIVEIIRALTKWIDSIVAKHQERARVEARVEEARQIEGEVQNATTIEEKIDKTRDFLNKK